MNLKVNHEQRTLPQHPLGWLRCISITDETAHVHTLTHLHKYLGSYLQWCICKSSGKHQQLLPASHWNFLQEGRKVLTRGADRCYNESLFFFSQQEKIHVYKQSSMSLRADNKTVTGNSQQLPLRRKAQGAEADNHPISLLSVIWSLPKYCFPCLWKENIKVLFQTNMKNCPQQSKHKPG